MRALCHTVFLAMLPLIAKDFDGWAQNVMITQVIWLFCWKITVAFISIGFQFIVFFTFFGKGFKKLIRNRGYEGEISIAVDPAASDPLKAPSCHEQCSICATENKIETNKIQTNQPVITNSTENIGDKCDNNNEQNLDESNSHLADNQAAKSIHIDICVRNTKNTTENTNDDGHYVKTINGKFFMVNGANISCACPRSPNGFSKYCHLCDGYVDLILVRHTTFLNNLRFLLAMSSRNCKIVSFFFNLRNYLASQLVWIH